MYNEFEDLMKHLKSFSIFKEAGRNLCCFFAEHRFRDSSFQKHFLDASDDGGIDYIFQEGNLQFNIIQSKLDLQNGEKSAKNVENEIDKIFATIENPTRERCSSIEENDFIEKLRQNLSNSQASLDVYYLTTGILNEDVRNHVESYLKKRVSNAGWKIRVVFNGFDANSIQIMILNQRYGFTPYTGQKELKVKNGKIIEYSSENIDSAIFSTDISSIMNWFDSREKIKEFIQKNVRGYLGETKFKSINKKIQLSYDEKPHYFWFKHNGIIIFVDHYSIEKDDERIILSNPQIVNGAQTINAIFGVFNKEKDAQVLVRIVKIPYDRRESYEIGLDIIEALNSQTEVKPSDLHSNDEQQVKLENLIKNINSNYLYFRKREKGINPSKYQITLRGLARYSFCCIARKPHEAISVSEEKIFEKKNYNIIFPKDKIMISDDKNKIIYDYLLIWRLRSILDYYVYKYIQKKDKAFYELTSYYALLNSFELVKKLKVKISVRESFFFDFIESKIFEREMFKFLKERVKKYPITLLKKSELQEAKKHFRNIRIFKKFEEGFKIREEEIKLFEKAYSKFERKN